MEYGDKNWEFIKLHLPDHLFDDIEGKGSTRNFNTKPDKKLHSPLKNYYKDCTNFKNVAGQVRLTLSNSTYFVPNLIRGIPRS